MRILTILQKPLLALSIAGLISVSAVAQLSGVKTINPTGSGPNNYKTFTEAFNALNTQGVGPGGVTFDVPAGSTFAEAPPILTATGTEANPIVFRNAGSGANPVVKPNVPGTRYTTTVGAFHDGVIRIAYGDYITFNGIDVHDSAQFSNDTARYEFAYLLMRKANNAPKHITITNSRITLDAAMRYSIGIYQSKYDTTGTLATVTTRGGSCDSNFYENNYITAKNGIRLIGQATVGVYDDNSYIRNNIVTFGGTNGSYAAYGIYTQYQQTLQVDGNQVTVNPLHTYTTYGFYLSTANNANTEVQNNRLVLQSSGASLTMYGFYISAGGSGTNNVNKIHDNKVVGPALTTLTSGAMYLLYHLGAANRAEIYNNVIDSINRGGTGTTYGLYCSGAVKDYQVHHNIVRNISSVGTSTLYGMYLITGSGTVYNNQVSELYTQTGSTDAFRGIFLSSGSWKLYYNTVYLDAQSTGAGFSPSAIYANTTVTLELANNIFVNKSTPGSTGNAVAYKRSTFSFTKMTANSDRNLYYAGTGARHLLYQDVTYSIPTMRDYRQLQGLSPRDMMSVSEDIPFLNTTTHPYNLALGTTATQVESMGRPIAGITDDIDGNVRNTSRPDAGAYEGTYTRNDITAPGIGYTLLSYTSLLSNRNVTNVQIKDLSGVNVSATNKPRLYYRERSDTNTYLGNTSADRGWKYVIANNNVSPFNFTIDYSKLDDPIALGDTIEYFVIAQDSAATPNVGYNRGDLAAPPASVVLTGSNFPLSDQINYYVIKGGISGVINVGAGQTYTTLTGAGGLFEDINNRVISGDIEVNITSDIVEPGTFGLDEYASDDPSYRITIKPSAAVMRTISGAVSKVGLIRFNYADGITVDGRFGGTGNYLTFRNDASPGDSTAVFQLIGTDILGGNGCKDITIRNTNIIGATRKRATAYGILIGNTRVANIAGVENDNIRIISNNIMRAYNAVSVRGDAAYGPSDSIEILNNNIGSYDSLYFNGFRGIYMNGTNESTIQGNKIFNVRADSTLSLALAGIELGADAIDIVIKNNEVFNVINTSTSTASSAYGIVGAGAENVLMYNNIVRNIKTNTNSTSTTYGPFGIRLTSGTGYKLYYNTVNLYDSIAGNGTTAGYSAALIVTSTAVTDLDIRNNIFANSLKRKNAASKSYALWFASNYDFSEGITIDYNGYFVPEKNTGTTSFFVGREGTSTDYATRNAWRIFSTQDAYSQPRVNQTPGFVNDTNVVIQDGILSPAESTGTEISEIEVPNKDFYGNDRPKGTGTAPDLGTYEFEGIPGDFQAPRIDSFKVNLAGNQCEATPRAVSAYITDLGGTGADTVTLIYRVNGVAQPAVYMNLVSGTSAQGVWEGIIPAAPAANQRVVFNIAARDTAENVTEMTEDSAYTDAYLVVDAGQPKTINENTSTRLIASKNFNLPVTWTPGSITGDTLITPILTSSTRFYASITDGVCVAVDSVDVTVVPPVKPVAGFTVSEEQIPTLATLTLTDTSENIPDFWKWNITPATYTFVNGTTDTTQNPEVAFEKAGKYTIQLVARNAAGADTVTKTDVVEAVLEYCISFVGDGQLKDNITRVRLNTLYQQDTASERQFYSYVDYNALDTNLTTTLTRSKTYTLFAFNGGKRAGTVAAWIDYNRNGSFEDIGEKLGEQVNVPVNDSAAITFTVPVGFEEGINRMRIRIVGGAANLVSCANYAGGEEMLDYRISLCDIFENPLVTETEICGGDTVVADAMNPGLNFSWSNGAVDQSVQLTTQGEYEVTVSNNFCAIKDTIIVNIKPGFGGSSLNPALVFGGKPGDGAIANPDTVCVGSTLQFEVLPPAAYGNGGFATQWFYYQEPATTEYGTAVNGNMVFTSPYGSNNGKISFTPAVADGDSVYRISLHFINLVSGCDSNLVRYIRVNMPLNLNLGNDTSICQGTSLTLDAGAFNGYQWNTGDNTSSISVNTSGRYSVSVTDAIGCTAADSVLVNVAATPVADLGADTTICFGTTLTLNAQNPGASYMWNDGSQAATLVASAAGQYDVQVINFAGCTDSDTILVGMHSQLDAGFNYTANVNGIGGNIAFVPVTTTGVSYLWNFGDNFLTTVQSPVYQYDANGTYPVELTITSEATGCTETNMQQILINNLSVQDPALVGRKVQVYPNPYSNSTFLKYELGEAADVQIAVYDITGKMIEQVSQGKQTPGQYQFEVHGGAYAGVYFVRVQVNKAVSTVRIVKQN